MAVILVATRDGLRSLDERRDERATNLRGTQIVTGCELARRVSIAGSSRPLPADPTIVEAR